MEKSIIFKNVTKYYSLYLPSDFNLRTVFVRGPSILRKALARKYLVLEELNFEIDQGEIVGIVGPNGAGKSTLLSLIGGIIQQTSGTISVHGRVAPLLEHGAGLHPHLSGRDNIFLNGVLIGITKKEIGAKLEAILAFAELHDYIDQPLYTYSTGMMVRLSLAVALNSNAEILLIDEVLSSADDHFKSKVYDKMRELTALGTTIILVLHDRPLIERFCDRILEIRDKRIYAGF